MDGLKIIDMRFGYICGHLSGCRCSTNDRNRYDKESKTIICEHFSNCLQHFLKNCTQETLSDIKEDMKAVIYHA